MGVLLEIAGVLVDRSVEITMIQAYIDVQNVTWEEEVYQMNLMR